MGALTELLKSADIVVGLVLSMIALLGGGLAWWDQRHRRQLRAHTGSLEAGHEVIAGQMQEVKGTLKRVDRDLDMLRGRVATIETTLGSLARKEDVNALAVALAKVSAVGEATSQKVDTLYRAALAQSDKGR